VGAQSALLVEIGLTDICPKSGGVMATPGTPRDDKPGMYIIGDATDIDNNRLGS
jgi:hypothetical protein